MTGFLREHSGPVAASVVLHGLVVIAFVIAAMLNHRSAPPDLQPLPIDAVVVDARVFHAAADAKAAAEAKAAADAQAAAAAQASAAEAAAAAEAKVVAQSEAAVQAEDSAARAAADAKAAAERQTQADAAAARAADARRRESAEEAATAAAAAEAAEELRRATAARKALEAKQAAEAREAADAKQAADARQAADAKRAADERAKKEREAELRRQLADEEHVDAVESGPLRDRYITLLRNKIQDAWIKPPSASPGVDCLVAVTQVPGGEVTSARVTQCNGDAAVRQSIENAVYRSSPLPDPPDPALFERNFVFRFKPQ